MPTAHRVVAHYSSPQLSGNGVKYNGQQALGGNRDLSMPADRLCAYTQKHYLAFVPCRLRV